MSPNTETPQTDNVGAPTGAKAQTVLKARHRRVSMSAQSALRCRAIESLRPDGERICYDPVAAKLMGPFWTCLSRIGFIRRRLIQQLDSEETGMANWIVGRTRYIDDSVKAQIEEGIKQLVILGAGYDTRAYRLHELEEQVRVFELDHLATLKFKVARVKIALRSFPKNLVYIPIDFTTEKLEAKLPQRLYDRNLKTLFIWEGVTQYLTAEAVDQTLAFIAGNSGKGSSVVCDYLFESVVNDTSDLVEAKKLRQNAARIGEPLLFGIGDNGIEGFLATRGFEVMQNLSSESLREAYFPGKGMHRKVFPLVAIVSAKVL
jgi:methyltransferase (TIGR00027 family)